MRLKLPAAFLAWLALVAIVVWTISNWPQPQPGQVKKISAPADREEAKQDSATNDSSAAVSITRAEVVAGAINFRSRPEVEDRTRIRTLNKGTTFEVLKKDKDWLYVKLDDGQSGYVANKPDIVQVLN